MDRPRGGSLPNPTSPGEASKLGMVGFLGFWAWKASRLESFVQILCVCLVITAAMLTFYV